MEREWGKDREGRLDLMKGKKGKEVEKSRSVEIRVETEGNIQKDIAVYSW